MEPGQLFNRAEWDEDGEKQTGWKTFRVVTVEWYRADRNGKTVD